MGELLLFLGAIPLIAGSRRRRMAIAGGSVEVEQVTQIAGVLTGIPHVIGRNLPS